MLFKHGLLAVLFTALAFLAAPEATASPYSQRTSVAKNAVKRADYIAAVLVMEPDIALPSMAPKVLKLYAKDKTFKTGLSNQISSVTTGPQSNFEDAAKAAALATQVGLFTPTEHEAALQSLRTAFAREVVSGSVKGDISVAGAILSGVDADQVNRQLLKNSIIKLEGKLVTDLEFSRLLSFARTRDGRDSLVQILADGTPTLTFRRAALMGSVASFDATFATQRLAEETTTVYFDLQSTDGLIPLDLKAALAKDEFLKVVDRAENAEVVVKLRQLALALEKMDESTRTVAYQQYQVNMLAAVLLMPDNATYQFEYSQGGYQYEFAFDLKLTRPGAAAQEILIRDSGQQTWSECKNQRIVNVFGGTQPASFNANAEMQSMCGNARPRITLAAMRSLVVRKLATEIASIGLKKRASNGGESLLRADGQN